MPAPADQILVTIGETGRVTESQLETAMRAAPFATQFPAMDEPDQAYLRGDMLLRLARAEALYQEAVATGVTQSAVYKQEINNFATTTLAQRYLYRLQRDITVPEEIENRFKRDYAGNGDALTAARSAYVAQRFSGVKENAIKKLREQAQVKTSYERLNEKPSADTVLAEGDGIRILYGDLMPQGSNGADAEQIRAKADEWIDLTLMAKAAESQGEDIDAQLAEYGRDLAVRMLLKQKEQEWIPNERTLTDYFQRHPDIGYIPERRQIGQIVLADRERAEQMRARILAGESLFELAGQHSIDPYGRQRMGDMGWLAAGSAAPAIENGIGKLADGEISEPIETGMGWHLVTIVDRKPAERKDYAAIKDRVRQKLVAENMSVYIREVTDRYPLQWRIAEHADRR